MRKGVIIAYLIWKGSYNASPPCQSHSRIIAYLIWKGSYNRHKRRFRKHLIIAYLIWKGSYNCVCCISTPRLNYSISDLERKL